MNELQVKPSFWSSLRRPFYVAGALVTTFLAFFAFNSHDARGALAALGSLVFWVLLDGALYALDRWVGTSGRSEPDNAPTGQAHAAVKRASLAGSESKEPQLDRAETEDPIGRFGDAVAGALRKHNETGSKDPDSVLSQAIADAVKQLNDSVTRNATRPYIPEG
jgi:hypothetical protein